MSFILVLISIQLLQTLIQSSQVNINHYIHIFDNSSLMFRQNNHNFWASKFESISTQMQLRIELIWRSTRG